MMNAIGIATCSFALGALLFPILDSHSKKLRYWFWLMVAAALLNIAVGILNFIVLVRKLP